MRRVQVEGFQGGQERMGMFWAFVKPKGLLGEGFEPRSSSKSLFRKSGG